MVTSADIQQALDSAGRYVVPAATPVWNRANGSFTAAPQLVLDAPIFLDQGEIAGTEPGLSAWESSWLSHAVVPSWQRGLVDATYEAQSSPVGPGFRTNGAAYLMSRGSEMDLGPALGPAATGYGGFRKLQFSLSCSVRSGSWRPGDPLYGVAGFVPGYARVSPRPWAVYWEDVLVVAVRTSDGADRYLRVPQARPAPATELILDATLDLSTATLTGTVNGAPLAADYAQAGSGWGPGLALEANDGRWPCTVGSLDPLCNSRGYPGAPVPVPDVVFARVGLAVLDAPAAFSWALLAGTAAPATYPGGPHLPLARVAVNGTYERQFIWVHRDQGVYGGPAAVRDLTLRLPGRLGGVGVFVGSRQADLVLDRLSVVGGGRAASNSGQTGGCYDVDARLGRWEGQSDQALWLAGAIGSLDRVALAYWGRRAGTLWDSCFALEGCRHFPGAGALWAVYGNTVQLTNCQSDFEGGPYPRAFAEAWAENLVSGAGMAVTADDATGFNQPFPGVVVRGAWPGWDVLSSSRSAVASPPPKG